MIFYSILTGRRPHLLAATLRSLETYAPANSYTIFHNGADKATRTVYEASNLTLDVVRWRGWTSIGESTSKVAAAAIASGMTYWIHLEDDWELLEPFHAPPIIEYLESRPHIGQVKLRVITDRVMRRHHITGRTIMWLRDGPYRVAVVHPTFNPALTRIRDLDKVFPVAGEIDFMRKWPYQRQAQHPTGYWTHIGGNDSLRPAHPL